jgi:putative transposase
MRTYSFKKYNNKRENEILGHKINIAGIIYNHFIALHKLYYRLFGKYINYFQLQKHITKLKKLLKYKFWNQLNLQAIQDIVGRIDKTYALFFNNLKKDIKTAPPQFKKVKKFSSITLKQTGWNLLPDNDLAIMGKKFSYLKFRGIGGTIKTVKVKRDAISDFWLFFVTIEKIEPEIVRSCNSDGVDFGLKTFLTTSNNKKIESPLFMRRASKTIKAASQKLLKKKKGSKNRTKARLKLARKHRDIANKRKDFHFKLALSLVQANVDIFIEDLNLKGMMSLWGKKVADLGFANFVKILEWEVLKNSVYVHKINRFYPSSKTCSTCDRVLEELSLGERGWVCPKCCTIHDRDLNAAINIHRVGASTLGVEEVRPALAGSLR